MCVSIGGPHINVCPGRFSVMLSGCLQDTCWSTDCACSSTLSGNVTQILGRTHSLPQDHPDDETGADTAGGCAHAGGYRCVCVCEWV